MQVPSVDPRTLKAALALLGLLAISSEAHAFDCAKASTKYEKAICADPVARAADEAMGNAFTELTAAADAKSRAAITAAQLAWLEERNGACDQTKGAALGACLARESDHRRAFLSGQPEQGPGAPGKILPWFRFEKGGDGKAEVDMELLRFAEPTKPGEHAFNDATAKLLDEIEQPQKGDYGADHYAYVARMRLVYASPKLISAQADTYSDSGGAHPNSAVINYNLDVAAGKIAKFEDAFEPQSAKKIFDVCMDQVKAEKKDRLDSPDPLTNEELTHLIESVSDATSDFAAWSFETSQAIVTYNPYAVGSYVEGSYDCKIGYDVLRPLTKPTFPLP